MQAPDNQPQATPAAAQTDIRLSNHYTSNLPGLGTTWQATVDTSGQPGASLTVIVGYADKDNTPGPYGQWLVDLGSPKLFQVSAPVTGSTSNHSIGIPNDPSLARAKAYTQAVIIGGGVQVTNGIKLRIN